jgi:hypothetical protein
LHTNRKKEIRFAPQCTHTNAITKIRNNKAARRSRENEKKNTHKILSKPLLNWLQLTLNRREEGKMGRTRPKA